MANTLSVKKQNRWIPVIASVFLQMVCGTAYIWSIFQTEVATKLFINYGDNKQQAAALSFSILLAVLTFGSTVGGRLSDKYSPRPVLIGGGVIIFIGFFLASFYTPNFAWLIYLTYGVLGGFGMGALYSTTIATCQKWFPDKRGFISGVIVSALGFGSAVFTIIAANGFTPWTTSKITSGMSDFEKIVKVGMVPGVGTFKTFFYLSFIFLVMCIVAAFFIKSPPQGYMPEGWTPPAPKGGLIHQNFSPKEMLKTSQFYFITFGLMLACVSGLMVINFASQIAADRGVDKNLIFWAVVVISICNAAGRLFWGTVSDKIGRKNTVMTLLAFTVILILSIAFFEKGGFIIVLIGALGFLYGGFLGTFPAITADYFGTKNAGMNYGIVLLGFGIGAVFAANVGGFFRDQAFKAVNGVTHPEKMIPAFVIGAVCAVIGLVIMFFLKPPKEKAEK